MQFIKKASSLIIALSLVIGSCAFGVLAKTETTEGGKYSYTEDFSAYDSTAFASATAVTPGKTFNTDWTVSSANTADGNLKVYGAKNTSASGSMIVAGKANTNATVDFKNVENLKNGYKFSVETNYSSMANYNNTIMGVRFMVDEATNTYYQLATNKSFSYQPKVDFVKVVGGQEVGDSKQLGKVAISSGNWSKIFRYEVVVIGSQVSYKVTNTADSSVLIEGTYIDPSPIEYKNTTVPVAAYVNGAQKVEFDNFSISQAFPYIDLNEPSPVLYKNIFYGKTPVKDGENFIYDLGAEYTVRRIVAAAGADVEISVNGETYTALAKSTDFVGGQYLNRKDITPVRYVRMTTDAAEIYVDTTAKDKTIYTGYGIQLAAYVNNAATDVVWSANNDCVTVDDGLIIGAKKGTATVTVKKSKVIYTIKVNVGSELEGAIANGTTSAYIAKVAGAVNAYDAAIAANDTAALEAVVFGTEANTLADIGDFDASVLKDLTAEEKTTLLNEIIKAGTVADEGVTTDSVKALLTKVNEQAARADDVALVNKVSAAAGDAEALKAIVTGDIETSIAFETVDTLIFEEDLSDDQLIAIVSEALASYKDVKAGDGEKLMGEIIGAIKAVTESFIFEDDFSRADGYTEHKAYLYGDQIDENWAISDAFNANGKLYGVRLGLSKSHPENGGAINLHGYGQLTIVMLNLRNIPELEGNFKFELDSNQYDNHPTRDTDMGVAFMVDQDAKTYYEIFTSKIGQRHLNTITFQKRINGQPLSTSVHTVPAATDRGDILHYEVSVANGQIEYKVTVGDSVLIQGVYVDPNPIEYTDKTVPFALRVMGDNVPVEMDNFKITGLKTPYLELPEPTPVIYNDVAENIEMEGNVITLEKNTAIRRIKFDNAADVSAVRASVDGVNWDNLAAASDFKEGEWLNRVSKRKYKYVEIANGKKPTLYTDVYKDDTYTYYVGEDADIALYGLGEHQKDVEWKVSNTSVAVIKDGKLRAKKAGTVTISAEYRAVEVTTNFVIKSKLDDAITNGTSADYISALKPTYDAINDAIKADDAATLKAALKAAAEAGNLTDFDAGSITDLSDSTLEVLCDKLIANGAFGEISTDNVTKLYNKIYALIPQAKAADTVLQIIKAAETDDETLAEGIFDGSALSAFESKIEFVPAEDIASVPSADLVLAAERLAAKYTPFDATASRLEEKDIQTIMNDAVAEIKNIKACNVVSKVNDAIEAEDAATVKNILVGTGAGTMGSVESFDRTAVAALSAEEQTALAQRIVTYGKFETAGDVNSADVDELIKTINIEYAVGKVSGIEDVTAFGAALNAYNDYLKLPLDDVALEIETNDEGTVTVIDETLAALAGKVFVNNADLTNRFISDFVLRAFENMNAYQSAAPLYLSYNDHIGADADKLEDIVEAEGETMYTFGSYVIENRDTIDDLTDVANLVDTYEIGSRGEIEEGGAGAGGDNSGGYTGTGGGVSLGSGSSISVGSGIITNMNALKDVEISVYKDVPTTHWAYNFIKYLNAHGSISGYGDGTFAPENNVKRGEFVKILISELGFEVAEIITQQIADEANAKAIAEAEEANAKAAEEAAAKGEEAPEAVEPELIEVTAKPFNDVEITSWYAPYIIAAKDLGLVMGDGVNCNPEANITREEMAAVIYRAIKLKGTELDSVNAPKVFADEEVISDWARLPIMNLYKHGIISGISETEIAPAQLATRAQVAKMIGDLSMKILAKEAAANEDKK